MTTTPPEQAAPAPAAPAPTVPQPPGPGEPPAVEEGHEEARYFVIQDSGDTDPWALVAVQPRGLYEMWTGDTEGWVDMPFFVTYFSGGDIGAKAIEDSQVEGFKASIPNPSPGAVALLRGDGKGVAPPADPQDNGPGDAPENDKPVKPDEGEEPDAETSPDPKAEAETDPAGETPPAGDDPEAGTGDDSDDDEKPGKPKKGVNPFPKKGKS